MIRYIISNCTIYYSKNLSLWKISTKCDSNHYIPNLVEYRKYEGQMKTNWLKHHTKTKGGCTMFGWAYFRWQIIKIKIKKIKKSCVKVQLNPKKCEVLKSCTETDGNNMLAL